MDDCVFGGHVDTQTIKKIASESGLNFKMVKSLVAHGVIGDTYPPSKADHAVMRALVDLHGQTWFVRLMLTTIRDVKRRLGLALTADMSKWERFAYSRFKNKKIGADKQKRLTVKQVMREVYNHYHVPPSEIVAARIRELRQKAWNDIKIKRRPTPDGFDY